MRILEKAAIVLLIMGMILEAFLVAGGSAIILFGCVIMIIVYGFFGGFLLNRVRARDLVKKVTYRHISISHFLIGVLTSFSLLLLIVGSFFKIFQLPFCTVLLIGLLIGAVLLVFCKIHVAQPADNQVYKSAFKRLAITFVLGISVYLTPSMFIVKFLHRDNPEYIEAYQALLEDPDNDELRIKAERARHGNELDF